MIISYTVPEIWRVTVAQKFKIKKNKKNAWRYPHFTHVYQKVWSDDVQFLIRTITHLLFHHWYVSWSLSRLLVIISIKIVTLNNSRLSTILYFINVEVQLNSKNLPMKLCMRLPEFHPNIPWSYVSYTFQYTFWVAINAIWWSDFRFLMSDFLGDKFVTQTQ